MKETSKVVAGTTQTPAWVESRNELGIATRRSYGLQARYADDLIARWPDAKDGVFWCQVDGKAVNEWAKEVNGERDAFYAVCVEGLEKDSAEYKKAHGAARTQWSRVRETAQLKLGLKIEQEGGTGERDLDVRYPEELLLLYKAGARAEKRSTKVSASFKAIRDELVNTWKIDLSNI